MEGKGFWMDNMFIERLWRIVRQRDTCAPEKTVLKRVKVPSAELAVRGSDGSVTASSRGGA
jgi:hypothetical protein